MRLFATLVLCRPWALLTYEDRHELYRQFDAYGEALAAQRPASAHSFRLAEDVAAVLVVHDGWLDAAARRRAAALLYGYTLDIAKGGAVGSSVVQFHLADDPLAASDSWSEAPHDPPRPHHHDPDQSPDHRTR